ncbi:MAG: outer membrane protein assembly factor BamD [Acidobacteriia bacterium]|nr:outer membrane protein assembly factor BamD [Terriglobia bacterium]
MRRYLRWMVFLFILAGLPGCGGQKGAKLQKSVVPPDKTLFQTGNEFLDKSQFTQARLAFQTLINTYPGSDLEPEAYFAMANSFLREGGTENLLMAEDRFRNFIIFFPTNPKAPDAQLEIISILMRQMRAPDRDQKETRRAEAEILKFLTAYPNNDYVPVVKTLLDEVRESLAESDMMVGDQYAHTGNYLGAVSRYRELTQKYPRFSRMDEALFKQAEADQKTENTDEAVAALARIVRGYPFSKYFSEAKAQLEKMGKPVPAVDTDLAAQNQALVKPPVPFSPLKPIIDLASAMGFISSPDRYEEARKTVAATKAAAAASTATQTGAKPGEIVLTGTIAKDANGKEVVKPNVSPAKTDKKDDKKVDDKTKKKKKAEQQY